MIARLEINVFLVLGILSISSRSKQNTGHPEARKMDPSAAEITSDSIALNRFERTPFEESI